MIEFSGKKRIYVFKYWYVCCQSKIYIHTESHSCPYFYEIFLFVVTTSTECMSHRHEHTVSTIHVDIIPVEIHIMDPMLVSFSFRKRTSHAKYILIVNDLPEKNCSYKEKSLKEKKEIF